MLMRGKFIFLLLGFFLVLIFINWLPRQSSDWASWVQAFGSIGAIVGSVFLTKQQIDAQHRSAVLLEHDSRLRRWQSVKALLDSLYQQCLDVEEVFQRDGDFGALDFIGNYYEKSFDDAIGRLNEIPLFELNSDKLVFSVIGMKDDAETLSTWIKEGSKRGPGFPTEIEASDYWVKEVAKTSMISLKKHYLTAVSITGGHAVVEPRKRFWRHNLEDNS